MTFEYDARKRLTSEARVLDETDVYDLTYTYDQLGNRRTKTDDVQNRLTKYVYDTDWNPVAQEWKGDAAYEPAWTPEYETRNNRLLEYEVWSTGGSQALLRTVHYTYYGSGNAANITIKDEWTGEGDPPAEYARYHDLALYYGSNGNLWLAANDSWTLDEQGQPVDYQVTGIREFRFEGGGQRNMTRAWHWAVNDPGDTSQWTPGESAVWTDSVGGLPFGDFEAHLDGNDLPVTTEAMRFLGGAGLHGQQTLDGENNPIRYLHGDLIDSTMMMTDEGATAVSAVSYTAFGEPVGDADSLATRYQYAGGYGYESGFISLSGANGDLGPITLQHVGARWYDPALGRFVQRDPIGIDGGLNLYLYCDGNPLGFVDPLGLDEWIGGGPWWARWFLNATGGRRSWLDDEETVNKAFIGTSAVGLGASTLGIGLCVGLPATGVAFTEHGLKALIARGLTGTVVENTIRYGTRIVQADGTIKYVYENVVVIVNAAGQVVTCWKTGH